MSKNGLRPLASNSIGVFDSGVGGLTVVSQILKHMPSEKIIYFGDTARVPYGGKSKETITKFSMQIANFLESKNVKAIVVACNSVSSTCLPELAESFDVKVMGVVEPGVKAVKDIGGIKKLGIIGTERTIKSGAYEKMIYEEIPDIECFSKPCPLFVPLAEEGLLKGDITKLTVSHYLKELLEKGIDALILGCTHYPLLADCIKEVCGNKVLLIDPAKKLAEDLESYLLESGLKNTDNSHKNPAFYVSDNTSIFGDISEATLGERFGFKLVSLE